MKAGQNLDSDNYENHWNDQSLQKPAWKSCGQENKFSVLFTLFNKKRSKILRQIIYQTPNQSSMNIQNKGERERERKRERESYKLVVKL